MADTLPLGLRNRNPGNIRPSDPPFKGTVGENKGFVVFDTMHNGLRAIARLLLTYQDRYGIDSVGGYVDKYGKRHQGAIERWAPSADANDTAAYVAFVCAVLGCRPEDRFNFHHPDFLFWIITAIGEQENGHDAFTQNVTDAQIDAAIEDAIS